MIHCISYNYTMCTEKNLHVTQSKTYEKASVDCYQQIHENSHVAAEVLIPPAGRAKVARIIRLWL